MRCNPMRGNRGFLRLEFLTAALLLGVLGLPTPFLGRVAAQSPYGPPTVQFASSSYTVNEADGTAILTVTLSSSVTNVVTVNYENEQRDRHRRDRLHYGIGNGHVSTGRDESDRERWDY